MPKTFPIRLEVEEIALGAVLRKLNDMPGIAKLDLDLGHGGEGAGKKQLERQAAEVRVQNGGREPIAIKFLMSGPKHIGEISKVLGGHKSRAYGMTNSLSKKGLVERGEGTGTWQLTKKAMQQLGAAQAVPALPPPSQVKHGPKGRATSGSGNIVLKNILTEGPKSPVEIRAHAAEHGLSPKSISGVMDRAKRDGLIKKNGAGYELTAKGLRIETGASANG